MQGSLRRGKKRGHPNPRGSTRMTERGQRPTLALRWNSCTLRLSRRLELWAPTPSRAQAARCGALHGRRRRRTAPNSLQKEAQYRGLHFLVRHALRNGVMQSFVSLV